MSTNDDRDDLRRTLRKFLERHSAESDVRRLMDDERGYDPAAWAVMAGQLGLQGLVVPEEYGGAGFGYEELCVVFEEFGAALFPSPFLATVGLAVNVLLESGDADVMGRYLPGIASGDLIATVALSEGEGGWDDSSIRLPAARRGNGWTLTGVKRFVVDAHVSDIILVAARTVDGVSLLAVESDALGRSVDVEPTMDQTRKLSRVTFDETPATLVGVSGQAWHGLRRALRFAAVALAAEQVGGAQHVLAMSVEYAKMRHQFGRAIGSFQAVKHRLADMLVDVESAKSAAYDAARAVAERDEDLELSASVAKAFCSDVYFRAAAAAIQLHGGIGFTWEHPAHLYFKRATSSRFLLGTQHYHRDLVGRALGI